MIYSIKLLWILIYASLLIITCSEPDRTAGPGTENGNPALTGIAVNPSRRPMAGVRVIVYRMADNRNDTIGLVDSSPMKVKETFSDENGLFIFNSLASGLYTLELNDSLKNLYGQVMNLLISEGETDRKNLDTIVLQPSGTIRGVVSRGGKTGTSYSNSQLKDAFIQVKLMEIDRYYVTSVDGYYQLDRIPPGCYSILYYASDGFLTAILDSVKVDSSGDVKKDTVFLQPIPGLNPPPPEAFSLAYDSTTDIVRLNWRRPNIQETVVYHVTRSRVDSFWVKDISVYVEDTLFFDTLTAMPIGTRYSYYVSVYTYYFKESNVAGPLTMTVK